MNFIKTYKQLILVIVASTVLYFGFAYYLERSEFVKLISLYAALFFFAFFLVKKHPAHDRENFWLLGSIGIVFRVIFIVAIPNLSQDFYRFLWDGRLLLQGLNPYLYTPDSFSALNISIPQGQQLIAGMGELNASHFSNYPPINQLCFAIAALFAGKSILGSVIVLRLLIIFADIGILYFGSKILKQLNLQRKNIFWYFLNPFIVIELTGNLHFEGVMIFFFVWALYLLFRKKWAWAAILIGLSISVKLLPLLLLPLFLKWFLNKEVSTAHNFTSLVKFYSIIGATVLITFLPFLSLSFIQNFASTIGLWFQNFEFNASVYYIIRWIGFQIVGWNIIATVGKILPIVIILFILSIAVFKNNKTLQQLLTSMLFAVSFYFLLSTTIHPWYVATPLILAVFTNYKFPILWSFLVFLSYSAYGVNGFDEQLWLVALEYIIVVSVAIYEIQKSYIASSSPKNFKI